MESVGVDGSMFWKLTKITERQVKITLAYGPFFTSRDLGALVGLASILNNVIAISYLLIPHAILAQTHSCNKYLNLLLIHRFLLLLTSQLALACRGKVSLKPHWVKACLIQESLRRHEPRWYGSCR